MPYIPKLNRDRLDPVIEHLWTLIQGPGDLNYVISRLVWLTFKSSPSYNVGNGLMGVLHCVAMEFYRRQLAPYEDKKIIDNGDII